jgi:hypothetical protein
LRRQIRRVLAAGFHFDGETNEIIPFTHRADLYADFISASVLSALREGGWGICDDQPAGGAPKGAGW